MYVRLMSSLGGLREQETLPEAFKKHYPKVRCIIDCSEIFIEHPTSFKVRLQTYSHYKKHNTVKFLIGITPAGVIPVTMQGWTSV